MPRSQSGGAAAASRSSRPGARGSDPADDAHQALFAVLAAGLVPGPHSWALEPRWAERIIEQGRASALKRQALLAECLSSPDPAASLEEHRFISRPIMPLVRDRPVPADSLVDGFTDDGVAGAAATLQHPRAPQAAGEQDLSAWLAVFAQVARAPLPAPPLLTACVNVAQLQPSLVAEAQFAGSQRAGRVDFCDAFAAVSIPIALAAQAQALSCLSLRRPPQPSDADLAWEIKRAQLECWFDVRPEQGKSAAVLRDLRSLEVAIEQAGEASESSLVVLVTPCPLTAEHALMAGFGAIRVEPQAATLGRLALPQRLLRVWEPPASA